MRLRSFLPALLLPFALLLVGGDAHAQQPKAERGPFALTNARIQTITDGVIEDGTIVIEEDRITAVGENAPVPSGAQTFDLGGSTVYPGLIDAGTRLGLVEVGSLSETRDYSEVGEVTPHMQALTAINPSSVSIPVTRVNGVTSVIAEPSGGLMPGTAALIDLFGYTPAQMFREFEAVTLDFPDTGRRGPWDDRSQQQIEKEAEEAIQKLNDTWAQAALYAGIDSARAAGATDGQRPEYAPALKALAPVVRGDTPLIVKVDAASDITRAIEWAAEHDQTENVIFSGLAEGWRVADEIAEAGIPCLVGPVLAVPARGADRYSKPYANAGLMREAGVELAIRSGEAENVRNLPYHAGFAAAYGLGREQALRAVTIAPARILGVADEIGSIEEGKVANLFVADGDPFKTSTDVEHLFIEGRRVPLVNRQTELFEEYLDREPGLEGQPGEQSGGNAGGPTDSAKGTTTETD
jgi:imidazolonepropionase-like amidohydrolase